MDKKLSEISDTELEKLCLNFSNDFFQTIHINSELLSIYEYNLNLIVKRIGSFLFSKRMDFINLALKHNDFANITLKSILIYVNSQNIEKNISSQIFSSLLPIMTHNNIEDSQIAHKIYEKIANDIDNTHFYNEIMNLSKTSVNDTVINTIQLILTKLLLTSKISHDGLILDLLIQLLNNPRIADDKLLFSSILEMISEQIEYYSANNQENVKFLCNYMYDKGFITKCIVLCENALNGRISDETEYLIIPTFFKFITVILFSNLNFYEHEIFRKVIRESFLFIAHNNYETLFDMNSQQSLMVGLCLDFLFNIFAMQIKLFVLVNDKNYFDVSFNNALVVIINIFMGKIGGDHLKIRSINVIKSMLNADLEKVQSEDTNLKISSLTHSLYKKIIAISSGNEDETITFYSRILYYLASPEETERLAVHELLATIISASWGPEELIKAPKFVFSYLLYRGDGIVDSIETGESNNPKSQSTAHNLLKNLHLSKIDKEQKYLILKKLTGCKNFYKIFPGPLALKMRTYVKNGPFYIQTVGAQSQVADMTL